MNCIRTYKNILQFEVKQHTPGGSKGHQTDLHVVKKAKKSAGLRDTVAIAMENEVECPYRACKVGKATSQTSRKKNYSYEKYSAAITLKREN